jgi:hypothetical protein
MGVYSPTMMAHFTEQLRLFTYFDMCPGINSGYTVVGVPTTHWGIIQNNTTEAKDQNGNLVHGVQSLLWTESKLDNGKFIEFDGITYRIIPTNDWSFEGGFINHNLERLVGDNGSPSSDVWYAGGTPV